MATLDDIYSYFHTYDRQSFRIYSCQGDEPSEADIATFEEEVGFRLPEDFRAFTMSPLGGLYMEAREELWPRPKEGDVGPFWSFLYGLKVFGIAQGIPDWLDLREQYRAFRDEGEDGLVPFLQREGDADRLCFDRAGRIVMWHHDDPTGNRVLEQTFPEVLLHEIGGLEERLQRKQASRRQA